jgi:hypothetical protein
MRSPAAVAKQAQCKRDWIALDAAFSNKETWTPADLKSIRTGRSGRKVIAYPYWRRECNANKDGN